MKLIKSLVAAVALTAGAAHAGIVPVGVQTNVSVTQVAEWGWTTCYQGGNGASSSLAAIKSSCAGNYVMLADKNYGSSTFSILAAASFDDVFFNVGSSYNGKHTANGAEWYFSDSYSMGYSALGNTVARSSCDTNLAGWNGPTTVGSCWHTGGGNLGYGWGFNTGTGWQSTQERFIMVSSGPSQVPEPGSFALLGLGLLGLAAARKSIKANKA